MVKKKIQLKPKSTLGLNDKLHICYNCCYYQTTNNGWCPWEEEHKNYNDKCNIQYKHWPYTAFRYRFDLPYKLIEPNNDQ